MVSSLSTLPIELLYRLLDYLDIQTILLSFRYVSKTFYLVSESCHRYNLDLSSTSKKHFNSICHLIYPEHIISITLSDEDTTPGQIKLFFSLFQITDFPKLRSLTLQSVDTKELDQILHDILHCTLTSFSFYSNGKRIHSTFCLLSSLIIQPNLHKLSMNTHAHHLEGMFHTVAESYLTYLTIGTVIFKEYKIILRHCPHLQVLILDDCWINELERLSSIQSYRQVKSLTVRDINRSMTQLESLLLLTPSLIELKIINSPSTHHSLIDGFRWETFIQTKLCSLDQFQFIFHQSILRTYDCHADVESLIKSFRTSFWVETKQWFVNCQSIKTSHTIQLYSIPFLEETYEYHFDPSNILLSTSMKKFNQSIIMNHVCCLSLNLTEIKTRQIRKQIANREDVLFPRVIDLKVRLDGEWPNDALHFISTLINLSNLQTLSFQNDFNQSTVTSILDHIKTLIDRSTNLDTLIILPSNTNGQYHTTMATLCLVIFSHIKHLTLKIQTLDDMKFVLEKLTYLSSMTFYLPSDRKINHHEIIQRLRDLHRNFTYLEKEYSLRFWFHNHRL